MAVFQFIEGFYNPSRRHSALRKLHMLADYVPIEWDGKRIRSVRRADCSDGCAVVARQNDPLTRLLASW